VKYYFFIIIFSLSFAVSAKEFSYMARSPQALLMGDAYTAIADDEYTFFYNPAALGRNKGVSSSLLNPAIGLPDVYHDLSKFQKFPNTAAGISGKIMEYPIYMQLGAFPTLKMSHFGITMFANNTTSLVLHNATHPMLDINYRYDRGFIMGAAYNVGTGAFSDKPKRVSKAKITAGTRWSTGFAIKHINRQGLQNQFDLFGTTLLNKISSGATDTAALKSALGYSTGDGWGFDVGTEFARTSGNTLFTAGLSILDIGDTHFSKTSGSAAIPKQDMSVNTGVAFKQDFTIFDYTLAADLHPITSSIAFARQVHLGIEASIPFVTAFGGWSEGYLSYGASVKLWPVKLTTGFYGVETGTKFRQQEAKRFVIYLSLFDFSIDL
jgi:hypothetical protein